MNPWYVVGMVIGIALIMWGLLKNPEPRTATNPPKVIKQVVDELLTIGICSVMPVNITRILYKLGSKLEVGLSDEVASNQDKLVLSQLNLRKIVQLEQRKVKVYGSDNMRDEGYWILTELGKDVIRYLQVNKQVRDKEGSLCK